MLSIRGNSKVKQKIDQASFGNALIWQVVNDVSAGGKKGDVREIAVSMFAVFRRDELRCAR